MLISKGTCEKIDCDYIAFLKDNPQGGVHIEFSDIEYRSCCPKNGAKKAVFLKREDDASADNNPTTSPLNSHDDYYISADNTIDI